MDFLCPACQKMLTVPDQYAGTLMKCPLCQSNFQAPALPAKPGALAPAAAPATVPPPPGGADIYGVKDPIAAPPMSSLPPAPPLGSVSANTGSAAPALNKVSAPPPPPPLGPSTEYRGGFTIPLSPKVLPYVAPVCLFLVFVLTLFPWVGYYWNGTGQLTQGAWGALIGSYGSPDLKLWETVSGLTLDKTPPGANLVLLPFLFLLLVSLPLAIASAALPHTRVKLPLAVDQFQQYRWGLVGGLALLSFLFLLVLLVLGFSMESNARAAAKAKAASAEVGSDQQRYVLEGKEYEALGVQRTTWFRLVLILELVAAIVAGLTFWLDYRGARQPIPQLAMRW
jgi:hypothetical protein